MRKLFKLIGWLCIVCVLLIGGWFTIKILIPSLAATPATVVVWKAQVIPRDGNQQIAFTPDGKQVLDLYDNYSDKTNGIRRWDVASGKELPAIESQQNFVLLSKNGQYYMAGEKYLYRISGQKQITALPDLTKRGGIIQLLGEKPLVVIYKIQKWKKKDSTQRSYSFWDVPDHKFLRPKSRQTTLYNDDFWSSTNITFSDDGTKAFSLWPVFTQTIKGKTSRFVEGLEPFSYSDNPMPKEAWLLNEVNGNVIKLPFTKQSSRVQFMWMKPTLSNDAIHLAATSTSVKNGWSYNGEDGSVWCYDLSNRKLQWTFFQKEHFPDILRFSADNTMLANGGYFGDYKNNGGYLNVIDTKTGKLIQSYTEQTLWQQISDRTEKAIVDRMYHIAFLKNRFKKNFESYYRNTPPGNSGLPTSLAWSPDSKMLAAAYADGSLKLWQVRD